ncbi:hypothetical protein [Streptomyces qinglanensis]|uniref:hypothetical protein n=1 Tax=Streptomyces qinglanensis TaxID=943816 RepID=UPI003D74438E
MPEPTALLVGRPLGPAEPVPALPRGVPTATAGTGAAQRARLRRLPGPPSARPAYRGPGAARR